MFHNDTQTFTPFSRLPTELQLLIWTHIYTTLTTRPHPPPQLFSVPLPLTLANAQLVTYGLCCGTPWVHLRPMLHACRLSCDVAISRWNDARREGFWRRRLEFLGEVKRMDMSFERAIEEKIEEAEWGLAVLGGEERGQVGCETVGLDESEKRLKNVCSHCVSSTPYEPPELDF